MNSMSRLLGVLMVLLLVTGCASVDKTAFTSEAKKKIKTVAVMEVTKPDEYVLNPGQLPGGAAFYAFGAVGGLVLGGIEATRLNSATQAFTASIKPANPEVAKHWNESVQSLLQAKGYAVTSLAKLPLKKEGKGLDCAAVADKFDALLVSTLEPSYVIDTAVEPNVRVTVKLMSSNCEQTHFSDAFLYSAQPLGEHIHITRDEQFGFPTREALIADPQKARLGLRTGVQEIAKKLAFEF